MSADERAVVEFKTELASSLIAADECAVVERKTELASSLVAADECAVTEYKTELTRSFSSATIFALRGCVLSKFCDFGPQV